MAKKKPPNPKHPSVTRSVFLFWFILVVFTYLMAQRRITDVDIWWHIRLGQEMLSQFSLPDLSRFYWSPILDSSPADLRYSWLGDILFYAFDAVVGIRFMGQAVFLMLLGTAFLLVGERPFPKQGRTLLLLLFFMAGTYQLQLLRNAIFGLPALVTLLWLWRRFERDTHLKNLWFIALLVGVWSCLHGSFLLGFGVFSLMLVGDLLDRLQLGEFRPPTVMLHQAGAWLTGFALISLYNPLTLNLVARAWSALTSQWILLLAGMVVLTLLAWQLRRVEPTKRQILCQRFLPLAVLGVALLTGFAYFYRFNQQLNEPNPPILRAYQEQVDRHQLSLLEKVKHGLNQTFWKGDEDDFGSIDFLSPFDAVGDLHVWSSIALALWALFALARARKHRMTLWLPFIALIFLGLGYIRTIGFLSIISVFIIFALDTHGNPRLPRLRLPNPACLILAVIFFLSLTNAVFGNAKSAWLGLDVDHQHGWGPARFFPILVAEKAEQDFADKPAFTTIENGGYLLHQWFPRKTVYFDGFFAPHRGETAQIYMRARAQGNPDLIHEVYGAEIAIIGIREPQWFTLFNDHPNWLPVYLDAGACLFVRQPEKGIVDFQAEPLISEFDVSSLPAYHRERLGQRYIEVCYGLLTQGYIEQALIFSNHPIFGLLEPHASGELAQRWSDSIAHFQRHYGRRNSPLIAREFLLFKAFNEARFTDALQLGTPLIEAMPFRRDLLRLQAHAAQKTGNKELATQLTREYLRLEQQAIPDSPPP